MRECTNTKIEELASKIGNLLKNLTVEERDKVFKKIRANSKSGSSSKKKKTAMDIIDEELSEPIDLGGWD